MVTILRGVNLRCTSEGPQTPKSSGTDRSSTIAQRPTGSESISPAVGLMRAGPTRPVEENPCSSIIHIVVLLVLVNREVCNVRVELMPVLEGAMGMRCSPMAAVCCRVRHRRNRQRHNEHHHNHSRGHGSGDPSLESHCQPLSPLPLFLSQEVSSTLERNPSQGMSAGAGEQQCLLGRLSALPVAIDCLALLPTVQIPSQTGYANLPIPMKERSACGARSGPSRARAPDAHQTSHWAAFLLVTRAGAPVS